MASIFHHLNFFFPLPKKARLFPAAMASVSIFSSNLAFSKHSFHLGCWEFQKQSLCFGVVFFLWDEPSILSFCPAHPWLPSFAKERRQCYPFLSPGSLALAPPHCPHSPYNSGAPRKAPGRCSIPRRSLLGCQRLQSSPSLASIAWFPSPQLQKTRRADQCAAAQSTRLWLCGVTPNPGRQQGGRGFSKGRAWGEEACRDKEGEVDPG